MTSAGTRPRFESSMPLDAALDENGGLYEPIVVNRWSWNLPEDADPTG